MTTGSPLVDGLYREQAEVRAERERLIQRGIEVREALKVVSPYTHQYFRLLEEKRQLGDRQRQVEAKLGELKRHIDAHIYRASKPRHESLPDHALAVLDYAEQTLTKVIEEFQVLTRSKAEQNAMTMAHMARARVRKLTREVKDRLI
jgi:hypothetical protein